MSDNDKHEIEEPEREVGQSTITEYRTNQMVRLAEIGIGGTATFIGIRYRKELPAWASITLMIGGTAMVLWNAGTFIANWRRDGKLIHEAIKLKKKEEAKIREKIIKGVEKVEAEKAEQKKSDAAGEKSAGSKQSATGKKDKKDKVQSAQKPASKPAPAKQNGSPVKEARTAKPVTTKPAPANGSAKKEVVQKVVQKVVQEAEKNKESKDEKSDKK